jgi:hypothetical protein
MLSYKYNIIYIHSEMSTTWFNFWYNKNLKKSFSIQMYENRYHLSIDDQLNYITFYSEDEPDYSEFILNLIIQ